MVETQRDDFEDDVDEDFLPILGFVVFTHSSVVKNWFSLFFRTYAL